jgi:hypothetical protein
MRERALRPRKIDQRVGIAQLARTLSDDYAVLRPEALAGTRPIIALPAMSSGGGVRSGEASAASMSACPIRPPAPAIAGERHHAAEEIEKPAENPFVLRGVAWRPGPSYRQLGSGRQPTAASRRLPSHKHVIDEVH